MSYFVLALLFIPPLLFAISSGKTLVYYALLTAGIPFTVLMPGTTFLGFLGGIAPQAAYLFVLVIASAAAMAFNSGTLVRCLIKEFFLFSLLAGFATLSLFWSDDYLYGIRFLVKLFAPFLFLIVVLTFIRTDKDVQKAERAIFICCLVVLMLALANHFSGGAFGGFKGRIKWINSNTLTAPYMSPANFSFLMGCGALLSLGNYIQYRRIKSLITFILFSGAILWAFTRISMAGMILGSGVIIFLMGRSMVTKTLIPMALVVTFVIAVISVDAFKARMFFEGAEVDSKALISEPGQLAASVNTSGRLGRWKQAAEEFRGSNKLIGAGVGSVDAWLAKRFDSSPLHSDYYRLYLDLGVIGLVVYLGAIFQILLRLWRQHVLARRGDQRKSAAVALGALALYAVTLATDNSLNYVTEFGLYVFALGGLALVTGRNANQGIKANDVE